MKNNKGFTLMELLGVIVLLGVLMLIAVPSIMGISKKIKENMLESKIEIILADAKLYGEDYITEISEGTSKYQTYPCMKVTLGRLLDEGYLSPDKDDESGDYLINPVDNTKLNDKNIIIYIKNKRIVTIMADANLDGVEENSCG